MSHEGILVPQPGIEPTSTALEDKDLTTGLLGKCQGHNDINSIFKK